MCRESGCLWPVIRRFATPRRVVTLQSAEASRKAVRRLTELVQMRPLGVTHDAFTPLLGLLVLAERFHEPAAEPGSETARPLRRCRLDLFLGGDLGLLREVRRLLHDGCRAAPHRGPAPAAGGRR